MKYKIEYLPVGDLTLNPENPRFIKDDAYKRLVQSLKDCPALFDARPCLCSNRTQENIILGGNMRYRAALELKYKKVPTIIMSDLTVDQEHEIAAKDNADNFGEWDFDILANEWSEYPLEDWGVDIPREWKTDQDETSGGGSEEIVEAWKILVDCTDEDQQVELLTRFEAEGIKCRALIS